MAITIMIIGIAAFIGVHLIPAHGVLRNYLVNRLNENGYKMLFTGISVLGFALLVYGRSKAGHTDLWQPGSWGRNIAPVLMLPAMILLAGSMRPTNIKRLTPHPMLWGAILWSVAHLLSNGDIASILLFGSFGLYSGFAIASANKRGAQVSSNEVTFAKDAAVVGLGIVLYIAFVLLHGRLFGTPLT